MSETTIAGADHDVVPATASIDGDGVLVLSPKVPDPVAVCYGWADDSTGNPCDSAGLPESPLWLDRSVT